MTSGAQAITQAVFAAIRSEMVMLFGSRCRENFRPDSDIDLLILSSEPNWEFHATASRAAFNTMRKLYVCRALCLATDDGSQRRGGHELAIPFSQRH